MPPQGNISCARLGPPESAVAQTWTQCLSLVGPNVALLCPVELVWEVSLCQQHPFLPESPRPEVASASLPKNVMANVGMVPLIVPFVTFDHLD